VIVAEDITSHFLNVINLFNNTIPLIAVQMNAVRIGDQIALIFNTVLGELSRGPVDEDEEILESADRSYWEARASKEMLGMTDQLLHVLQQWDPKLELKYNKFYIGLTKDGTPDNFVSFRPKRAFLRVEARVPQAEQTDTQLEEAGIDLMPYDKKWGKYRLRLTKSDLAKHESLVTDLLRRAHENRAT
jgi:hypothetical protein